ncbi:GDP-L-galactose phosphorylase 2-like [Asparagus officinalis]|uniref:GDP-L-galactose phosphorylase 2-like n=1 Tax=Asparagus officinalis TaxID=4686 RepID=UPI00098E7CC1|nr:GDP-L-galactose phosphorylase 2-like [Asparagus officinalis]
MEDKDEQEKLGGCGRNCLSKCCLSRQVRVLIVGVVTVKNVHVEQVRTPSRKLSTSSSSSDCLLIRQQLQWLNVLVMPIIMVSMAEPLTVPMGDDKLQSKYFENGEVQSSFLDKLLQKWDDRLRRGLFHYDITTYERKVIPGEYGFITQLVEGRDLKKRPTEFRVDKVLQPFDEAKFNFTKIGLEEALFRFEGSENEKAQYFHDSPISESDPLNFIAINVSPIGHGHVLLIPRIKNLLPQRIDQESFLLAFYLSREAGSPYFKVGYNSLGAFATINHLHFQAFYLPMLLPAEKAITDTVTTLGNGVRVLRLVNYPVKGIAFECGDNSSIQDLAATISNACIYLQDNNHPYNVLISDLGKRVFLFLQNYAEKRSRGEVSQEIMDNQVNPAVWELSGYMVLKRREDYGKATEESMLGFLSLVSLSEEKYRELQENILNALFQGKI